MNEKTKKHDLLDERLLSEGSCPEWDLIDHARAWAKDCHDYNATRVGDRPMSGSDFMGFIKSKFIVERK